MAHAWLSPRPDFSSARSSSRSSSDRAAALRRGRHRIRSPHHQSEFAKFSRLIGQGVFATPVQPARATGLLGFDVGIAATALKVDTGASYWLHSVPAGSDFVH